MTEEKIQDEVVVSEEPEAKQDSEVSASAEAEPTSPMQEEVIADVVNIQQGAAQNVTADKVTVTQGGIVHVEGRFIDVKEGGIAVAMGENVTITDGAAVVVAADNVKMTDSLAIFVAANEITGENVRVIIDVRAAAFFALVFGAVVGVMKMLLRRQE